MRTYAVLARKRQRDEFRLRLQLQRKFVRDLALAMRAAQFSDHKEWMKIYRQL